MATNSLGPNTVNIGVNMPKELRARLEKLAQQSGKKLSAYVRDILADSVENGVVYEQIKTYSLHVAEDPLPHKSSAEKNPQARKARPNATLPRGDSQIPAG